MNKTITIASLSAAIALPLLACRRPAQDTVLESGLSPRVLYYVDPMHPAYKSSKPGIAPDCGMQLTPVYAQMNPRGKDLDARKPVSPAEPASKLQSFPMFSTVIAEKIPGIAHLHVQGKVVLDSPQVYRVSVGVEGVLRETYDGSVGSQVHKDQKLAAFTSPELLAQENSYLVASDRRSIAVSEASRGLQNAADRLRNLGMSDPQIKELGESRHIPEQVYLLSPATGIILSRTIAMGQRFEKGTEFYRIADLSHVSIFAEVPENDVMHFQVGTTALLTCPGRAKSISARVSAVLPQGDESSRSVKVRLEAANPGIFLRPDMFVDIDTEVKTSGAVRVPASAVLDSGLRQRVFVDQGGGNFQPREVEIGSSFGSSVEIVRGLTAGERVMSYGNYLFDSETRLTGGLTQQSSPGTAGTPGGASACSAAGLKECDLAQFPVPIRRAGSHGRKS